MRGLKFKAFDSIHRKVYDVLEINFLKNTCLLWLTKGKARVSIQRQLDEVNIMQSTNWRDEENEEIYEDYIVTYGVEDGIVTARVVWEDSEDEDKHISGFVYKPLYLTDYPEDCDESCYRVIGNIYENPELLEVK